MGVGYCLIVMKWNGDSWIDSIEMRWAFLTFYIFSRNKRGERKTFTDWVITRLCWDLRRGGLGRLLYTFQFLQGFR